MPRSAFSVGTFADAAAPGLSKLAQAVGGGKAFNDARDNEVLLQSRLAQALSQMNAHDATAALANTKADEERATMAARAPEAVRRTAMLSNSVPLDEEGTVENYLNTGALGGKYAPAADGYGPALPAPDWAANLGKIASSIAGTQRALAIGDKSSENIAKAGSIERGDRLSDSVIAGALPRNVVAGAQAAVAGKPLFHMDGTGGVLDQFAGGLDTSNPLAQSTIGLRDEQAGAASALAAQRRQVTPNGPGPGKVPIGYRYVQGEDGEARLEPIPGGPKDPNAQTGKPMPAAAAKGYLDNMTSLRQVDKAIALMQGETVDGSQGDPDAVGAKGYFPDSVLQRVDKKGVATRALVADIGSLKIHDRSGAAVTAAETPRLKPFIPAVTDDPKTVLQKLQLFRDNYQAIMDQSSQFYRQSGYNVPRVDAGAPPGRAAAPGAAPAGWSIQKVN